MSILVTGGAGFIGANFVLDWLAERDEPVINVDKLTYAGNRRNLTSLDGDARHVFVRGDIGDTGLVARLLAEHRPRAVVVDDPATRGRINALMLEKYGWRESVLRAMGMGPDGSTPIRLDPR